MTILVLGLALFFATHSVRLLADDWRTRQVARLGERPWKGLYSLISLVALVMIIWGYGAARSNPVVLWQPPGWGHHAGELLAVIGFVLIAAAYVPGTRIKATLGHPMTAGVAVWALGHLLANGTLRAALLFGTFLVWAIVVFIVRRGVDRKAGVTYPPGPLSRDAIAIVAGIAFALLFARYLHGPLIGVRPFG